MAIKITKTISLNVDYLIRNKGLSTSVGDEGGFAPMISNNYKALELSLIQIS